jgi:putative transposase
MSDWISTSTLATLACIAPRNARNACQKKSWRGADLNTREVPGRGRGGVVIEVEVQTLPAAVQKEYFLRLSPLTVEPTIAKQPRKRSKSAGPTDAQRAEAWERYERAPDSMKARAHKKLEMIDAITALTNAGFKKTDAVAEITTRYEVSTGSLYRWMKSTKGWPTTDRLALLLEHHCGRVVTAEFTPAAWAVVREDYLRLEGPALTACVDRAKRHSIKKGLGWSFPSTKTIQRKIEKDIPAAAIVLAREGVEALERLFPAQERDHGFYGSLGAVNADGHKFDVFVRWEDGTIGRPLMAAFQDIRSGKFLGYRIGQTENSDLIRLAFGDLVEDYGIPDEAFLDNGRGFASKWLTGGAPTRFRFKVKEDEPSGIFTQMGVKIHWCTPYHGQAKPIERAFRDLCEYVAKHPAFAGAYTGNNPTAKPENYGSRAIPIALFKQVLDEEMVAHDARTGRRGGICAGRSFNEVFTENYQQRQQAGEIRMPAEHQRRLWLLTAEAVKAKRGSGELKLAGNRYWTEALAEHAGNSVVIRFDPEKLHDQVWAYTLDGRFIGSAECIASVGFGDTESAREHSKQRNRYKKAAKIMLTAERRMDALTGTIPTEADAIEVEAVSEKPIRIPVEHTADDNDFNTDEAFARAAEGLRDAL